MYRGNTLFGVCDKDICGDDYTARMVYYTKRVPTKSVPLESEVLDLTENENAADAGYDELGSRFGDVTFVHLLNIPRNCRRHHHVNE